MKHIGPCILAMVLLAASTARAGVVDMVLDSPVLYGSPGNVLSFTGTLTNTSAATVWLNADNYNLAPELGIGSWDDSPFFANAPLFLPPGGTSGDIGLFNITIPGSIAYGSYGGNFTILGGTDGDSQDILSSADFTVPVGAAETATPEPGTLSLAVAAAGLLLAWKRRRR